MAAAYVVDVERLADADSDEGFCAEALHGEGHAARVDVPDCAERLEDPHPSSSPPTPPPPLPFYGFASKGVKSPAGGEGFRACLEAGRRGGGRRGSRVGQFGRVVFVRWSGGLGCVGAAVSVHWCLGPSPNHGVIF
jgi:hypothetical protein